MRKQNFKNARFSLIFSSAVYPTNKVENITVHFQSAEEYEYDQEQIKKISKVQQIFKRRKLIIDFDYYAKATRFNFQIYWLRTKRLLLFKIFIFGEETANPNEQKDRISSKKRLQGMPSKISYVNLNDQTMVDHFHSSILSQRRKPQKNASQAGFFSSGRSRGQYSSSNKEILRTKNSVPKLEGQHGRNLA